MQTREEIEKREDSILASYAMHSKESQGRLYPEKEHLLRTIYQRDRDRIVHCEAFRNLEYKTQVFVIFEGDYYRTRLTHTLEVAQIARTIGRSLRLNEDLIEAIALAHDLGHAPFGHAGEVALEELMKKWGGFNHNLHGYRIVTELEKRYPNFSGLNLTCEVREGIIKHKTKYDLPALITDPQINPKEQPTLEAQVVDIADEIAYDNHDLDDGLTSNIIKERYLEKVTLWHKAYKKIKKENANKNMLKYHLIRELINQQVTDLLNESEKKIKELNLKSIETVRKLKDRVISFSKKMQIERKDAREFLENNLYNNVRIVRMTSKAKRFIRELFEEYKNDPKQMPPDIYEKLSEIKKEKEKKKLQIICDYIAGMTDRYALDEHKKLFNPYEKV
ncbi:MAG: deoxyguanosinetriphosphate triphosphohydrolase [Candidatus Omnitrophota bacterium]